MSSLSLLVGVLDQPSEMEARARRDVSGLMRALESVPDQRKRRGRRFNLVVVLAMAVFAVCCGASTFAVIAETVADLDRAMLAGFGLGRRRPPSAATFRRVLNRVDPVELDEALSVWATVTDAVPVPEREAVAEPDLASDLLVDLEIDLGIDLVVAMDGKTLKGARNFDEAGVMRQEAVVEAVEHGTRQVHGLARIVGGDENAAVKDMVDRIAARRGGSLAGVVITADAKHTTRELTAKIIGLGGHYLLTVKGNAPAAYAALDELPWAEVENAQVTREKGHGRQETRAIRLVTLPEQCETRLTGVVQAARIRRSTKRKKTVTTAAAWTHENVYIVTSLSHRHAQADRVARIVREHWGCEVIHWQRDVVFGEDGHTARTGNGPINLAILRNTALTRDNTKDITAGIKTLRARARKPE
ncbi:ISAs1 family transposase, partial [Kribbella catacumbae]|uniref:ISAs1 family transposase n=3 Tax=Kribbella catacumbae TaxID=460086 RepID=UPI00036449F7